MLRDFSLLSIFSCLACDVSEAVVHEQLHCRKANMASKAVKTAASASSVAKLAASASLRELRLHLCPKSSASAGAREFVTAHYAALKRENVRIPILIRECSGVTPRAWARHAYGHERSAELANKNAGEVLAALQELARSPN